MIDLQKLLRSAPSEVKIRTVQVDAAVFRKEAGWPWWRRLLRLMDWTPVGRMTSARWVEWHRDEAGCFDREVRKLLKKGGID
jgi:hypothetical protein